MNELKQDLRKLTVTLNAADIPEIRNTIDALVGQIQEKDKQIENLTQYVETKNRYIDHLEEELAAHEGQAQEQPEDALKEKVTEFIIRTIKNSNNPVAALPVIPQLLNYIGGREIKNHAVIHIDQQMEPQDLTAAVDIFMNELRKSIDPMVLKKDGKILQSVDIGLKSEPIDYKNLKGIDSNDISKTQE